MISHRVVLREASPDLVVALIEQPDHIALGVEVAIESGVLAGESTSGKHRVGGQRIVIGQLVLRTKRHALKTRLRMSIRVRLDEGRDWNCKIRPIRRPTD